MKHHWLLRGGSIGLLLLSPIAALPAADKADAGGKEAPPVIQRDDRPVCDVVGAPVLTSYAEVLEKVRPSVVSVHSTKVVRESGIVMHPLFGPMQRQPREERVPGLGSGVIVSPDGFILTNNHVVEGADELEVALSDDRRFPAKLIGRDPKTDVAVIKIEASGLPHATLADSDRLRVGDVVFALGNPLGVGQTVTMGIVSALGRSNLGILDRPDSGPGYEDFIQTDAAINPGNSGGALIDAAGRLVGINTAIVSPSRGNIGIGFAIPVNLASTIMQSLVSSGEVQRGYLGVNLRDLTAEMAEQYGTAADQKGAIIADVVKDSPADEAGLRRFDIIIAIGGKPVRNLAEARLLISQTPPGSKVSVKVLRDKEEKSLQVEIGRLDGAVAASNLGQGQILRGVAVAPVDDKLRRDFDIPDDVDGVVVTRVADDSPFAESLPVGAVIMAVNRKAVQDARSVRAAIREGRNIFVVNYGGGTRFVPLNIRAQDR